MIRKRYQEIDVSCFEQNQDTLSEFMFLLPLELFVEKLADMACFVEKLPTQ